jgi:hypothetical protein
MKPRMTLGWTQYLVVIFGLCTVAFTVDILCGEPYTGLAEEIARVSPGGRFDRADIRAGDFVFTQVVTCQRSGEWDRVLALAAQPLAESRDALQRAAADRTTDAGKLAAFVLKAAEQRHLQTFTQATPRLLSPIVFSHEELQLALDTPTISRLVVARVDVDARGCATRVSLRDLASTETLAPLVVERLQRAIFVPARPNAAFIGGAMDISLFVDVR